MNTSFKHPSIIIDQDTLSFKLRFERQLVRQLKQVVLMSSIETKTTDMGIKKMLINMLRFIDMKLQDHPKEVAVCLS